MVRQRVVGGCLQAIIQLQRNLLAVADWNRYGEELRVRLHTVEVVLQFVRVRGDVVRDEYPAGA